MQAEPLRQERLQANQELRPWRARIVGLGLDVTAVNRPPGKATSMIRGSAEVCRFTDATSNSVACGAGLADCATSPGGAITMATAATAHPTVRMAVIVTELSCPNRHAGP